jgi:hypothetical protein
MSVSGSVVDLQMPSKIWIEYHDSGDSNARDVIVEMDGGTIYTAVFVTASYLFHQMQLTFDLSKQIPDTIPARFVALNTPHIVVESLDRSSIEDTIDNLLAMEIFESVFTRWTDPDEENTSAAFDGNRTTQEVAAAVLSDVLVTEDDDLGTED